MKVFKLLDHVLQTLLITFFVISWRIDNEYCNPLIAYFIVTGGNALSCLVHFLLNCHQEDRSARDYYQRLLLFVVLIGLATSLIGVGVIMLAVLLPFISLLYWWISLNETVSSFLQKSPHHESL